MLPRTADVGPQYQWNREELFASGALTVADLLERIPGVTGFRSGWLASPKFTALNGDLDRVRLYYDGIEMDNLDPVSAPLLDLTTVELWTLESVQVERFANELRVHLRSWIVDRTNPYTRTDVFTGDEDTNLYRGFYGKRFGNGFGLQLGGQQFSTRAARLGGGGDALSFMARAGIAKRMWSIDAFGLRRGSSRTLQPTFSTSGGLSIRQFDGNHDVYYLRAGLGNPSGGVWAQVTGSYMRFADRSSHVTAGDAVARMLVADTTDTTTSRYQYVGAAGYSRGAIRGSIQNRVRAVDEEMYHAPAARLEVAGPRGVASVHTELDQFSRSTRADVIGRFTPLPFLAVAGAYSRSEPFDSVAANAPPPWRAARLEVGIRLLNPWLIGGLITRDTAVLVGPQLVDTAYKASRSESVRGCTSDCEADSTGTSMWTWSARDGIPPDSTSRGIRPGAR